MRTVVLALVLACLAGASLRAEDADLFGLPACQLPTYGEALDPEAEPDEDRAGRLLPSGTCVQVSGSVQLGAQRFRGNASSLPLLARLVGLPTSSSTSTASVTGNIRMESARRVDGLYVGVVLDGMISDGSGRQSGDAQFVFSEGSLRVERMLIGYASSRFNFWDPGDFWTGTLAPQRSVPLAALDVWQADGLTVTVSLERPELSTPASPDVPLLSGLVSRTQRDSQTPDFVGMIQHEGDEWTFFAAVALRQLHDGLTNRTIAGRAATVGASYEGEIFGATHYFSTQASIAQDMPGYLGTTFDSGTIRSLITGGESVRGLSVVASVGRDLTDEITVNAYASYFELEFPSLLRPGGARAVSTRGAVNLVWAPHEHVRFGVEYGLGRFDLHLPGGTRPAGLPLDFPLSPDGFTRVTGSSATIWMELSF